MASRTLSRDVINSDFRFYNDPLIPIIYEEAIIINNEIIIRTYTFKGAPFHSFLYNPQRVAKTIVRAINIPHDVKVNGPILLFPIP